MTRKVLMAVVVFAVAATVWHFTRPVPITNAHPSGSQIIAFGDSLTAGTGAGPGEDYPSQLARLCGREIVNRGVPGDTTADGLRRLDRDVLGNDPRIVIVALGGNDILQRVPVGETFGNLARIVDAIQARGALVVLVGVQPLLTGGRYKSEFKRLAREKGAVLVPNVLSGIIDKPSLKADQVHPNGGGYRVMAERVHGALEPYL